MTMSVVSFPTRPEVSCDEALSELGARVVREVFDNDVEAFHEAFAQTTLLQQMELIQATAEVAGQINPADIDDMLEDAIIGVFKQWLGEHGPGRKDEALLRVAYGNYAD